MIAFSHRWMRVLGLLWGLGVGSVPVLGEPVGPVLLTTQHVDLRVRYAPETDPPLEVLAVNDDLRPPVAYAATNVVLVVAESARLELPADIPPLGAAGDPIWVLPASQQDGLLYPGVSGEDLPGGVFDGPIRFQLVEVVGPGDFYLWQAELGGLQFWMNTRDGIGPEDAFPQAVGGHSHLDWGFTATGIYRVTVQVVGRKLEGAEEVASAPTVFTFHVLPLPNRSPFEEWQDRHWPGQENPAIIGESADPEGDGLVNLWEYALGRAPEVVDPPPLPGVNVARGEGMGLIVTLSRAKEAEDVVYTLQRSETPGGPWTDSGAVPEVLPGAETVYQVRFRVPESETASRLGFFRVRASLEQP